MKLTGNTTMSQGEPGINGNKGIISITQSFRPGTSPPKSLQSYPEYSFAYILLLNRNTVDVFYSCIQQSKISSWFLCQPFSGTKQQTPVDLKLHHKEKFLVFN